MILTSNRGFAEWGEFFGDPVVATALLDRLLHHAIVIQIEGSSYRLRQHADLVPNRIRSNATAQWLNRRPRRSNVAVDRQKPEVLITQTADRRPRQVGKIARPKLRRFRPVDTKQPVHEQARAQSCALLREQGRIRFFTSRSDDAHNSRVVSIDAPIIHDLRIMVTRGFSHSPRADDRPGGIIGSTSAHSASVRSLGYRRPRRSAARRRSGFHISAPPVDNSGGA